MSGMLQKARDYEKKTGASILKTERPVFHLTPQCGWMNDPNGFSYYSGKYHLFYQYNPYDVHWDAMHWGHAVSTDLLHWEYLPAALAPDSAYDDAGCFSGSAVELDDGRQLLMYTGVNRRVMPDGQKKDIQVQCVAVGNGLDYEKYAGNPVIDDSMLPPAASIFDFRDPKLWRKSDGTFCCAVASRPADGSGQILLYTSADGFSWKFWKVLDANCNRFGKMWECPDFFELDGMHVLMVSPQNMTCEGEFNSGNGTLCILGDFDEKAGEFTEHKFQTVDSGIDFYAMQTVTTPDGRRIMIGWLQNWDLCNYRPSNPKWYGQMSLPRELYIKNGRLCQKPVRELESLHGKKKEFCSVKIEDSILPLDSAWGKCLDLSISVKSCSSGAACFSVRLFEGNGRCVRVYYDFSNRKAGVDRTMAGSRNALLHERSCNCDAGENGEVKMRIVADRNSVEAFFGDGEKVMSLCVYDEGLADGVSFEALGCIEMNAACYKILEG